MLLFVVDVQACTFQQYTIYPRETHPAVETQNCHIFKKLYETQAKTFPEFESDFLGKKSIILLLAEPVLPKFGGGASLQNDFDFRLLFL